MLAYLAISLLLAATQPVEENVEDFDAQEELRYYYEDDAEAVLNDDFDFDEYVFFEEENELADNVLFEEDDE